MRLLAALLAFVSAFSSITNAETDKPLPFPLHIGGPYALTDQFGNRRSEADPEGSLQLLFFGYANCQQICTVALPLMADVVDAAAGKGITVQPVMITVDRERDSPDFMA